MDINTKQLADEALRELPQNAYIPVDAEFLERYENQISTVKRAYADKGGIHVLSTDESDAIIVRVPSAEILRKTRKNAERIADPLEQDLSLVNDCLLYPSVQVLRGWLESGSPGLASVYARKLLELSKTVVEAEAKKL